MNLLLRQVSQYYVKMHYVHETNPSGSIKSQFKEIFWSPTMPAMFKLNSVVEQAMTSSDAIQAVTQNIPEMNSKLLFSTCAATTPGQAAGV
jgi:hypothetical protein